MNIVVIDKTLSVINLALQFISIVFITYVFFDLVFVDRKIKLSHLTEKFDKFKRYDVFKSSLIYLVFTLYFIFFGKVSQFLGFHNLALSLFTFIANIFLLIFVYKLYLLLRKYVPKVE